MKRILLLVLVLFFGINQTSLADTTNSKVQSIHLLQKVHSERNNNTKYSIEATYPQLVPSSPDQNIAENGFNTLVKKFLHDEYSLFIKNANYFYGEATRTKNHLGMGSSLRIKYDTTIFHYKEKPFITVRFIIYEYLITTPHPNKYHKVINFDLANNKEVALKDLFKANSNFTEALKKYALENLNQRFNSIGDLESYINFKNWNVKPNGLQLTFDDFPNVIGPQELLVPYKNINDILLANSVVSICAENILNCRACCFK